MKGKRITATDLIFGVSMCAAILLYLSRIRMGMADLDESFYLTIPLRLTQGDALFVDEWHLSQLSSFLLYPLVKLYRIVVGHTDGIVLNFRYLYLVVQTLVTLTGYVLLRKRDRQMAAAVSMVYMLFTPFGIKAFSYNTMGLMAVYLFVVLNLVETRRTRLQYGFMGLFLAAAVLCNPYMILLYVIWCGSTVCAAFADKWSRRKGTRKSDHQGAVVLFTWEKLIFMTAGAGILLVWFLLFQLSRTDILAMIENLSFVVSDSAHKPKTLKAVFHAFTYYIDVYPIYFWIWAGCTAVGTLIKRVSSVCFSAVTVASVCFTLFFAFELTDGIGYAAIMISLTMAGLSAFLFMKKKNWILFFGWLVGVFYGFCLGASSNNGIYVFANACTISSAVSLMIIGEYAGEKKSVKRTENGDSFGMKLLAKLPMAALILLFCVQLFAESYILLNHIFWESGPEAMTETIEEGPLAGLTTTAYKKKRYETNYENVMSLRERDGEYIMFFSRFISGYLIFDDWKVGASSTWLADSAKDLNDPRVVEYELRHPERKPDMIYVDTDTTGVWTEEQWENYCVEKGYRMEWFDRGGLVLISE